MKKCLRYFACIVGCFFLLFVTGTLKCDAKTDLKNQTVIVVDDALLLMEEEADWLREIADRVSKETGWNVIVATCEDAAGKSAKEVCEANFNKYTTGDDGISCLLDMDNREIYFATAGRAMRYFKDADIEEILEQAYEAVSEEDYAQCLYVMLLGAEDRYTANPSKLNGFFWIGMLGSIAGLGVGIAFIASLVRYGKRRKRTASNDFSSLPQKRPYQRIRRVRPRMTGGSRTRSTTRTRSFKGSGRRF